MSPQEIISQVKTKLDTAVARLEDELKKLRTGRAHASMIDSLSVEAYGQAMPINQMATISTPEPQLLQITPFDANNLQAIAAAIRDDQSLGLNPMDDGRVVRIQIPPLTTERRQQIVKQLGDKVEDSMIVMRSVRHDALKTIDQAKKDKAIGEDEHKRLANQIDQLMSDHKAKAEAAAKAKEQEILTL